MNPGLFVCYNGFGDGMERIEKQMEFILEIDKEKQIKRKTLQSNGKDFEDDAQHAWHMAIMTLLLSEHANEEIDVLSKRQVICWIENHFKKIDNYIEN